VEDEEIRTKAVKLLARMFAVEGSTLASSYRQLFTNFLGRFNDKSTEIRVEMVRFAKHFLISHDVFRDDVNG
jgi:sister-chromatid-cohesion protein PDS5